MTTQTGYIMTLANSIIGVSLLAMPYCFKQCGIILGILLLISCNIVTRLACYFLIKSAMMCRRKSFEFVAYHAFGSFGKLLVELGVIGFLMGTSVAFFVVIGDLAPAIISKIFQLDNNQDLRTVLLLVTGLVIILPLSLLRNMESLAAISTFSMFFYMLLLVKVFSESFPHLASADWTSSVNFWRPEGILQCFPIFAVALSCQTQVFEILEVLPNPTLERMSSVVHSAVGLCTVIYIINGCLGYIAYAREPFGGNILLSFTPSLNTDIFQLGFVMSIALSFPIVVFPCRASLNSLLYKQASQYHEVNTQSSYIPDTRFKTLTVLIVGVALCTGLLVPNIEFVLGFVGSTIGVAICIIFPCCAFIHIQGKNTSERLVSKITLALGVLVMILGTYSNLEAAAGRNVVVPVEGPIKVAAPNVQPRDFLLGEMKNDALVLDAPKIESTQSPPSIVNVENRKEPPVPVPPVVKQKLEKPVTKPKEPVIVNEILPKNEIPPVLHSPPVNISFVKTVTEMVKQSNVIIEKEAEKAIQSNVIHLDAIAKEELELKEHNQLKQDDERKQKELLDNLQQHQEEQKKLLQEQQNILDEMKSRNTNVKQSEESVKADADKSPVEKPVEPINPDKFSDNIDKIQEVIDDLKERKQVMDKNKGEKIAEEKKRFAEKKILEKPIADLKASILMKPIVSVVNGINDSLGANIKPGDVIRASNPDVPILPGRDILQEKGNIIAEREKRDVENQLREDESCTRPGDLADKSVKEKYNAAESKVVENVVKLAETGIHQSQILSDYQEIKLKNVDHKTEKDNGPHLADVLQRKQEVRRRK